MVASAPRRCAAPSRALLVERRAPAARAVRDCRALGRHRGPHRRSSAAVCPRALAAARLVPDSQVAPVAEQTEIERGLQILEAELKRLEAEYNMYFAGRLPRPPWETRNRVDAIIKQYDRAYIQNYGDRFRFSTLQSRYA